MANTAEEDAREREAAWRAGGSRDYGAEAEARARGEENPYIVSGAGSAPAAPAARTWDTEKDKPTDSGLTVGQLFALTYPYGDARKIWEQQNAAAGAPPAPPPAPPNLAPAAPKPGDTTVGPAGVKYTYGAGASPPYNGTTSMGGQAPAASQAAPQGQEWGVSDAGVPGWYPAGYTAEKKRLQNEAAANLRAQQEFENKLKTDAAERDRVAQVANEAYQQELIRTKDAELAMQAADAAVRAEIARQANLLAQSKAVTDAAYQAGILQNQGVENAARQSALQQSRRQRRPYRALRVSVG